MLLIVTAPKHPRACLYLEWNPVDTKLVCVCVDILLLVL